MPDIYVRDYDWMQSKDRNIDDNTLCDFIEILEYQSERSRLFEEVGIEDHGAHEEALYVYLLDALKVPPEGHKKQFTGEHEAFDKVCSFSRMWFDDQFYGEYLLNNDPLDRSPMDIINLFRNEVENNLKRHYK
ncbi:hypothetical protein [Psychromonas aquimarina]|uniref:hypothetical protein n=1 Tax=Psychromonas aquimarina TaxID=444919 RepID=UPI00041589D3|nr:hypothetical protein [Psychromonas aquimarina]